PTGTGVQTFAFPIITEGGMDEGRGAFGLWMTRAGLIASMAKAAGWPKAGTERGLRALLPSIRLTLQPGGPATLVGFGSLSVARRRPRTLRNPKTGQTVTVDGRIPRFKPSKELKQAVR